MGSLRGRRLGESGTRWPRRSCGERGQTSAFGSERRFWRLLPSHHHHHHHACQWHRCALLQWRVARKGWQHIAVRKTRAALTHRQASSGGTPHSKRCRGAEPAVNPTTPSKPIHSSPAWQAEPSNSPTEPSKPSNSSPGWQAEPNRCLTGPSKTSNPSPAWQAEPSNKSDEAQQARQLRPRLAGRTQQNKKHGAQQAQQFKPRVASRTQQKPCEAK